MLRWAVRLKIGLDGFANLSRFSERMYDDHGVRAAIAAEEDAVTETRMPARERLRYCGAPLILACRRSCSAACP